MDRTETAQRGFGCEYCWPAAAEDAWEARQTLAREAVLVDSSHYRVMILVCGSCSQPFLSVFRETIDWIDGDDPQYWTLMPVTAAEAAELEQQPILAVESEVHKLWPERRSLHYDHPKDTPPRTYWGTGT